MNPLHKGWRPAFLRRAEHLSQSTRAAAMEDHPSSRPAHCTGAYDCQAPDHIHGCFADNPCQHPDVTDHELAVIQHREACGVCLGFAVVEASNGAEYDCIDCGGSGREADRLERKGRGL